MTLDYNLLQILLLIGGPVILMLVVPFIVLARRGKNEIRLANTPTDELWSNSYLDGLNRAECTLIVGYYPQKIGSSLLFKQDGVDAGSGSIGSVDQASFDTPFYKGGFWVNHVKEKDADGNQINQWTLRFRDGSEAVLGGNTNTTHFSIDYEGACYNFDINSKCGEICKDSLVIGKYYRLGFNVLVLAIKKDTAPNMIGTICHFIRLLRTYSNQN